jgi:hemolysin III
VPIYVVLGWAAVFWAGDFAAAGHPAVLVLVILGGVFYTLGAVVYGLKRPDPAPAWFGFHEIFHTMTIAAFIAHYTALWLLF